MDELFDFSLKEMEQEIQSIVEEAAKFRESDPVESRRILGEGLKKYPENDILLNNMLYVVNYTENPDETITLAGRLIEKNSLEDVKYDALRFLAYAYKAKGDLESAEAAIEQIPEIYFTKLTEAAFLLSGRAKYEAAEKQKWISFENLLQMMQKLTEYYEEEGNQEAAAAETRKALALIPILENDCFEIYTQYFTKQLERLNAAG